MTDFLSGLALAISLVAAGLGLYASTTKYETISMHLCRTLRGKADG